MDLYLVLGLGPDATAADIKRAYRRLARRYHPGINPGDRAAEAMFRQISEAYETLIDPAVAETVAAEAGVQTAVLDPLEGLTDESAGDDYLAVMRANLATLQEGQACA